MLATRQLYQLFSCSMQVSILFADHGFFDSNLHVLSLNFTYLLTYCVAYRPSGCENNYLGMRDYVIRQVAPQTEAISPVAFHNYGV